jgi:hypothetical protein
MSVNGKMRPAETIPGIRGIGSKNISGSKFKNDIFDIL